VTALERELTAVQIELPQAPDFTGSVLARVRRARRRRRLSLAAAVAVAALAAVLAVPTARTAVLRWAGLGGVTIERVPALPATSLRTAAAFGTPVDLARAARSVDFDVRLPRLDGLPARGLYLDRDAPSPIVTAVYGAARRPTIVLSEWRGNVERHFHKLVRYSAATKAVRIDDAPGLWVAGPPHAIFYLARDGSFGETPVYTTGNVLVWLRNGVSYRLELDGTLDEARGIAESLR
jgi:hypothetical protein